MANRGKISKLVVISIDASLPDADASFPEEPSLFRAVAAASRRASELQASDVSELLRLSLSNRQDEVEKASERASRMIDLCNRLATKLCKDPECELTTVAECYRSFARPSFLEESWPEVYSINVRLDSLTDSQDRLFVQGVRTGLQLPKEETDELARIGANLLLLAPEYQRLMQDLQTPAQNSEAADRYEQSQ